MSATPSQILKQLLLDALLVDNVDDSNPSWPCFLAHMPDSPDNILCIIDRPSKKDGRLMLTGEVIEHPGLEIYLRAKSYTTGWNQLKSIKDELDSVIRRLVTSEEIEYIVQSISRPGGIMSLGQESDTGVKGTTKRRFLFSLNLFMTVRETETQDSNGDSNTSTSDLQFYMNDGEPFFMNNGDPFELNS